MFDQFNLTELELQYKVIYNYQMVLKEAYGSEWFGVGNPFMTNAGYTASIKFLCDKIIPICVKAGTFEISYIKDNLKIGHDEILLRADIKNLQGKEQRQRVFDFLLSMFTKDIPDNNGYKF